MVKDYPGAGPAHHFPDSGSHHAVIAVDSAVPACRFVVRVFAPIEPVEGVCEQSGAVRAEFPVAFLMPAIHMYHQTDSDFLFSNAIVHRSLN